MGQIGRDTLAAIAEELRSTVNDEVPPQNRVRALAQAASSPEIVIRETLAGRETLGAIAAEAREAPRGPMTTKRYGDRISNAPGSRTPRTLQRDTRRDTGPEISIASAAVGRETLAAINEELIAELSEEPTTGVRSRAMPAEAEAEPSSSVHPQAIEVFEMMTFVARGEVSNLAGSQARRTFVEERLLHRLPVATMEDVDRIDVTPWTVKGTVIVRVWCVVRPSNIRSQRASG